MSDICEILDSGCDSNIQSFCNILGQSVNEIDEALIQNEKNSLLDNFPDFQLHQLISSSSWNDIKTVLEEIYNFGFEGTRNPIEEKLNNISNVNQNSIILLNYYNSLLDVLDKEIINSNNTTIISKTLLDNLKQYIKNYNLNENRCNTCNITNNCAQGGSVDGCPCGGQGCGTANTCTMCDDGGCMLGDQSCYPNCDSCDSSCLYCDSCNYTYCGTADR